VLSGLGVGRHTNLHWTDETALGRTAGTVETKLVDVAAGRG
jgi:hypothetical protein